MKYHHRRCRLYHCAVAIAALASPVGAAAGTVWSTQVTMVNDYLFRGLTQTDREPALQAGLSYTGASGFHASAWGSNISWLSDTSTATARISSSLELDGDAGWRWPLGATFSLDTGLHTYFYPGSYPRGFTDPDTTEAYLRLARGDWTLTWSHALTNLFGIAGSRHSTYLDLSWAHDLGAHWSLFAHLGRQQVRDVANASYSDWNAGVARSIGDHLTLALGYYGSNADSGFYRNAYGHYLGRSTAVLSVSAQW